MDFMHKLIRNIDKAMYVSIFTFIEQAAAEFNQEGSSIGYCTHIQNTYNSTHILTALLFWSDSMLIHFGQNSSKMSLKMFFYASEQKVAEHCS